MKGIKRMKKESISFISSIPFIPVNVLMPLRVNLLLTPIRPGKGVSTSKNLTGCQDIQDGGKDLFLYPEYPAHPVNILVGCLDPCA
jgi:hypothetical protein